jgi:hypothetical protein
MTTRASDTQRNFELGEHNDLPVIAADIIYEGSAVGDNGSGYARPLQAGDPFRGFALYQADNSLGAQAAINVRVRNKGKVQLAVSGAAITDVGKGVYASDDDTFVLTASGNSYIGRIVRWVSTGVVIVAFDAEDPALGSLTALTDNSSGSSGGDTIGAVSSSATAADGIATLAAKVNAIIARLK